jgi:calcium-binding protein CML
MSLPPSPSRVGGPVDPTLTQYRYTDELASQTPQFAEWAAVAAERDPGVEQSCGVDLSGAPDSRDAEPQQYIEREEYDDEGNLREADTRSSVFESRMVGVDEKFLERAKEVFHLFDYERKGSIATEDLGTVLGKNLREEAVNSLSNLYDNDGEGRLDYAEFVRVITNNQPMRAPFTETEVLEFFKVFDRNKSGFILAQDFVQVMLHMGEPLSIDDVNNMLSELSIDGDERINIQDFVSHMFFTSQNAQ